MTVLRQTPFNVHRVTRRAYHITRPKKLTVGIRREDSQRIWERRSPLVPEDIHRLVQEEDVDVVFQNCERRIWNDSDPSIRAVSIDYAVRGRNVYLWGAKFIVRLVHESILH